MNLRFRLVFLLLAVSLLLAGNRPTNSLDPKQILDLVNQDRIEHGLPQLKFNPTLNLAAQAKASDMVQKGYFAHEGPGGILPWDWLKWLGYNYSYAGENLASGFTDEQELENSWMSSSPHRANILSPYYSEIGLAVVGDGSKNVIVQFFGSKESLVTIRQTSQQ